jgi:hypothetical protein
MGPRRIATSFRGVALALGSIALSSCGDAGSTPPSPAAATGSSAAASPSSVASAAHRASDSAATSSGSPPAAPAPAALPLASASALASASRASATPLPAWLDAPPFDAPALPVTKTFVGARLQLSATWRTLDFGEPGNNPSNGLHSYLPFSRSADERGDGQPKGAVIVLAQHDAVADVVLDYGAGARFTWVIDETWQPATQHRIGTTPIEVLRGKGRLHLQPADLWQIRRKRVTPLGKTTLLVLAAVRRDVPDDARAGFFAALSTLTIE